jgi:hypothetical protein
MVFINLIEVGKQRYRIYNDQVTSNEFEDLSKKLFTTFDSYAVKEFNLGAYSSQSGKDIIKTYEDNLKSQLDDQFKISLQFNRIAHNADSKKWYQHEFAPSIQLGKFENSGVYYPNGCETTSKSSGDGFWLLDTNKTMIRNRKLQLFKLYGTSIKFNYRGLKNIVIGSKCKPIDKVNINEILNEDWYYELTKTYQRISNELLFKDDKFKT